MNQAALASRALLRSPKTGRFMSRTQGVEQGFLKPHGHAACGKGQYKSYECKAKAIRAATGGAGTPSQDKYTDWLRSAGL